jgi:hypothetical protein
MRNSKISPYIYPGLKMMEKETFRQMVKNALLYPEETYATSSYFVVPIEKNPSFTDILSKGDPTYYFGYLGIKMIV